MVCNSEALIVLFPKFEIRLYLQNTSHRQVLPFDANLGNKDRYDTVAVTHLHGTHPLSFMSDDNSSATLSEASV